MIGAVLQRVFRHVRYVVGASLVALTVFSAALLLPNWTVLLQILSASTISLTAKLAFFFSLFGTIETNFTLFSAALLVLTAVLFGINIALLTFYIRRRQEAAHHSRAAKLASVGGIISAALGIGCAACGSVVLTAVLGLFGAGGLIVLLPFHGVEFGVLGVVLLIVSIKYLIQRINDPIVCPSKYE